jgi:hypothetical protein
VSAEATAAKMFADEDLGPNGWRVSDIKHALDRLQTIYDAALAKGEEGPCEELWYLFDIIAGLNGERVEDDDLMSEPESVFLSAVVSDWFAQERAEIAT